MTDYTGFFLNSPSKVVRLQTLEILHSSFSKVYRIVRNNTQGLTAKLETGGTRFFEYYPCSITESGQENDMDSGVTVSWGDLGELLADEIDNLYRNDSFGEKPIVRYRVYRSDDLSAPMLGPWELEIQSASMDGQNTTFDATVPKINISGTGILYDLTGDFKTLKGLL